MTRKSPYKHDVKNHLRSGRPVNQYERGRGGKPRVTRKSRVVGASPSHNPSSYTFTVFYDGVSEKLDVDAKNYLKAIDAGMERRDKITSPSKIRIRRVK